MHRVLQLVAAKQGTDVHETEKDKPQRCFVVMKNHAKMLEVG